jgi:hypothetical protein
MHRKINKYQLAETFWTKEKKHCFTVISPRFGEFLHLLRSRVREGERPCWAG